MTFSLEQETIPFLYIQSPLHYPKQCSHHNLTNNLDSHFHSFSGWFQYLVFLSFNHLNTNCPQYSRTQNVSKLNSQILNDFSNFVYDFCGHSVILDNEQNWDIEKPIFTRCFFSTLLTWISFIVWIIFLPFEFTYIFRSKRKAIKWNAFNILRILLISMCLTTNLVHLCHLIYINYYPVNIKPSLSDLTSAVMKSVLYLLLIICVYLHRLKGIITSGRIWLILLLENVAASILFYQLWIDHSTFTFVERYCHLLFFPFLLGSFVIFCFADRCDLRNDDEALRQQGINSNPIYHCSFLSFICFSYLDPLMILGSKRALTFEDLPSPLEELNPQNLGEKFERYRKHFKHHYDEKLIESDLFSSTEALIRQPSHDKKGKKFSLWKEIIIHYGFFIFLTLLIKFIFEINDFAFPFLIRYLIKFVNKTEPSQPLWHGILIALGFLIVSCFQSACLHYYLYRIFFMGASIKSALMRNIYKKSFSLNSKSKNERTVGEMVNLMSVDVGQVILFFQYIDEFFFCPMKLIITTYLLYLELGYSIFLGILAMALLIPANMVALSYSQKYQSEQMKFKDDRIKLINEIISGIKIIKLYAWEEFFVKSVNKIRENEILNLKKFFYCEAVVNLLWNLAPTLLNVITFTVYTIKGGILTAEKVFVSLSLFTLIQYPLTVLPMMITIFVRARVSVQRITRFMNSAEVLKYVRREKIQYGDLIIVKNATFAWDKMMSEDEKNKGKSNKDKAKAKAKENNKGKNTEKSELSSESNFMLKDLNFSIKEGEFVAIIGPVGSGKSSFLSLLLGDMEPIYGTVNIQKGYDYAYVAQEAWILNETLRENILFGKEYEEEKYNKVISCCALNQDLNILPAGDKTEIGEKGLNLSGGQKQRVNIARACYNDADIYFFDDPLSAVDANVAKHLFENVLSSSTGLLKNKTRILVTNKLEILPLTDRIFVLKDGRITKFGTYQELMNEQVDFADLIKQYSFSSELKESQNEDQPLTKDNSNFENKLIENEYMESGKVNSLIYKLYFKMISFRWLFLLFIGYLMSELILLASKIWLAVWSNDPNQNESSTHYRLTIYGLLAIVRAISVFFASIALIKGSLRVSKHIHYNLLDNIIKAPMSFFDTTPSGRIVNRFSKDLNCVDNDFYSTFDYGLTCLFTSIISLFVISKETPWFLVILVFVCVFYYYIQKFYIPSSRQLRRLESVSISPIYSQFSETLGGVSTIKAYKSEERFIMLLEKKIIVNLNCYFFSMLANRWLAMRLEFCSNIIVFFAALLAVFARDYITQGDLGVSLTYAMSITYSLSWLVRKTCELETNIVSVERINEFCNVTKEADWRSSFLSMTNWPLKPSIEFDNYSTRYRPELDLVLKNLSAKIDANEKIGIVGRTGSGKSTITIALFRIIEAVEGKILIDNLDVSKIGLHDLREKLAIIPQDPIIFSGILRFNLDPFNQSSDDELWQALDQAHLKSFVESLNSQLDYKISENGKNLSLGQKQLICLARALLKKPKILVLDEATAAVDCETDSMIQSTIRKEFSNCTILTIAHRLNTILDSDRILVIDNGSIKESGSPAELLENQNSLFHNLAKSAGIV